MTEYYKNKLKSGHEYQDFIMEQLIKHGIIIQVYSSAKYQHEKGESICGIEIKYDSLIKETGNLYIEVAEKSNEQISEFTPSGIFRDDNTWLYLIGDYEEAYLFSKKQLQAVMSSQKMKDKRGIKEVKTDTSVGYLYPKDEVIKHNTCLKVFNFTKEE